MQFTREICKLLLCAVICISYDIIFQQFCEITVPTCLKCFPFFFFFFFNFIINIQIYLRGWKKKTKKNKKKTNKYLLTSQLGKFNWDWQVYYGQEEKIEFFFPEGAYTCISYNTLMKKINSPLFIKWVWLNRGM